MFTKLHEALEERKNAKDDVLIESEIVGDIEEDSDSEDLKNEMEELYIAHERSKLDGIEFATVFMEEGGVSEEMEDELDEMDEDDDLLTNSDIDESEMDVADEYVDDLSDMDYGASDESELTNNDESFDIEGELPTDETDEDLDDINIDDLIDLL
jgi:hypothetical protein